MRGETWALLVAALVPALTAITWVAHRHPQAYGRLWLPGLLVLCALMWVAGLSFNAGAAAAAHGAPRVPWALVLGVAPLLVCYVVFLRFLPWLLADQPRGQPRAQRRGRAQSPPETPACDGPGPLPGARAPLARGDSDLGRNGDRG